MSAAVGYSRRMHELNTASKASAEAKAGAGTRGDASKDSRKASITSKKDVMHRDAVNRRVYVVKG